MEKIYTVGCNEDILNSIGFNIIKLTSPFENDSDYHDFVFKNFKDADKIIIDLSINPIQCLKLGYHLRLSLNDIKNKCLIPILFTSVLGLEEIILKCNSWSNILTTKGSTYSPLNLVKIDIDHLLPLKPEEYVSSFLNYIQILPDESIGKHSVANQWGAFSISKAANSFAIKSNKDLNLIFKKLYFKYIFAFQFDYSSLEIYSLKETSEIQTGIVDRINSKNKKILLIDDEAIKGWEIVLKDLFKDAQFECINEQVEDYYSFSKEAKKLITEGDFDLFLVDLRLNGIKEDDNLEIDEFSGTTVLAKIKELNQGNQVIMFTASNKAWNLKPLLDLGADDYYIKESPEYKFSLATSKQNYFNFKTSAEKLLKKSYLKKIFNQKILIIELLNSRSFNEPDKSSFYNELEKLLDQSFDMHYFAKVDKQFGYAYVTLYMVLEKINNEFIYQNEVNKKWYIDGQEIEEWSWNKDLKSYENIGKYNKNEKPAEWKKLFAIWHQKFKKDNYLIQKTQFVINRRNHFLHNDSSLNKDIYSKEGFIELFEIINLTINLF